MRTRLSILFIVVLCVIAMSVSPAFAGQSGVISAGSTCSYRQVTDNPHLSSGDVSVHGSWLAVSGCAGRTAYVTIELQAYGCDTGWPSSGCAWKTVGRGAGNFKPGGGSGQRATARVTCRSSSSVGFRSRVDVDINGLNDPGGWTYSSEFTLPCYP